MHTIALNYQDESVRDKIVIFVKNFLDEKVEISDIEDLKDLLAIEEAKKENLPNISYEALLKEFCIENRD